MEKYITEIRVCLTSWNEHYPNGCVMYHDNEEIDGRYCDNTEEFVDFVKEYKERYLKYVTVVRFVFNGYDLDDDSAIEYAKEIKNHIYDLLYGWGVIM